MSCTHGLDVLTFGLRRFSRGRTWEGRHHHLLRTNSFWCSDCSRLWGPRCDLGSSLVIEPVCVAGFPCHNTGAQSNMSLGYAIAPVGQLVPQVRPFQPAAELEGSFLSLLAPAHVLLCVSEPMLDDDDQSLPFLLLVALLAHVWLFVSCRLYVERRQ
jgi:hypothetical protein